MNRARQQFADVSGKLRHGKAVGIKNRGQNQAIIGVNSQGNVVVGEALKLLSSQVVHSYIAAQAALSAHFYDNINIPSYITIPYTPDVIGHYFSGIAPDIPYLNGNSAKTSIINYYNVVDYALNKWDINMRV